MRTAILFAVTCLILLGVPAPGPSFGADVAPALLAAAKKEGTVVWYSSLVGVSDEIAKRFQQETGITVELYNAVTGKVITKIEAEKRAGIVLTDVVHHTSLYDMNRWKKEGLLAQGPLADRARFATGAIDRDGYWFGLRHLTSGIAYNKNKIGPQDVPRTWKDVLNPKFKGKIVYMSPSLDGMPQYTVKMLLDLYGWAYFKQLAELQPHMVESDGTAITLVISGEKPIAGTIAAYNALNASYQGQPVGVVFPQEGVPVVTAPTAVMRGAPHPNAARVFYAFLASKDVGDVLAKHGLIAGRLDVAPPVGHPRLSEIKAYFPDVDWLAKHKREMARQFDEVMGR